MKIYTWLFVFFSYFYFYVSIHKILIFPLNDRNKNLNDSAFESTTATRLLYKYKRGEKKVFWKNTDSKITNPSPIYHDHQNTLKLESMHLFLCVESVVNHGIDISFYSSIVSFPSWYKQVSHRCKHFFHDVSSFTKLIYCSFNL